MSITLTQTQAEDLILTWLQALTGYIYPGQVRRANQDALRLVTATVDNVTHVMPIIAARTLSNLGVGQPYDEVVTIDTVQVNRTRHLRTCAMLLQGVGLGPHALPSIISSGESLRRVAVMAWSRNAAGQALRQAGVSVTRVDPVRDVAAYLTQATEPRWDLTLTYGYVEEISTTPVGDAQSISLDVQEIVSRIDPHTGVAIPPPIEDRLIDDVVVLTRPTP